MGADADGNPAAASEVTSYDYTGQDISASCNEMGEMHSTY